MTATLEEASKRLVTPKLDTGLASSRLLCFTTAFITLQSLFNKLTAGWVSIKYPTCGMYYINIHTLFTAPGSMLHIQSYCDDLKGQQATP